jgi:mannose-1-phosphate guanylyltransferase
MTEHLYAAIMAGGGGTRLWPLSRRGRPKQSLSLIGDQTLFQMAMDRVDGLIPIDRTMILTVQEQADQLMSQVSALDDSNFILEPAPRGTASVIGLAAIYLRRKDPEAVMACLTADHFIPAVVPFQNVLQVACEVAKQNHLVTLGISPSSPDTGYGYIHRGAKLGITDLHDCYEVKAFTEKPDHETAKRYMQSGEYFWNSGMFIWHVDAILSEIEQQLPDLYQTLVKIDEVYGKDEERSITEQLWMELESITVDYGVMEGAKRVVVLPADDLGWIDVGDWGRLFDILPHDSLENVVIAKKAELLDSTGVLIYQDEESSDRLIAAIGLTDLVIIDTGDILFACPRSRAPEVKRILAQLKKLGLNRYF